MTFRGRLRLFFTIIVIVPMVAVAIVLFTLTAQSETGKADAGIATGLRTAFGLYRQGSDRAEPALRRVAEDGRLRSALVDRRTDLARRRMRELLPGGGIVSIGFYAPDGRRVASAGSPQGIAPKSAPIAAGNGTPLGTLAVSTTTADQLARGVARLSGLEVSVFSGGRRVASTVHGVKGEPERGPPNKARNFDLGGKDFRGRLTRIPGRLQPATEIAVYREAKSVEDAISNSRLLIGGILLAFLAAALLVSSVVVVRSLQGQIGQFLSAARGLARGKFEQPVPTEGRDEFAELGREFNSMSQQLEQKIKEVDRRRRELQETIRRVGAALATGLDRQGVVTLAVETAVEACEADAGRALPVDRDAFAETREGEFDKDLSSILEGAERKAFEVRPDIGIELLEQIDAGAPRPPQREAVGSTVGDVHALAVPMRARLGSRASAEYVGVMSIARRGRPFSLSEEELVRYLAGQAMQSIENASLHETVHRQAVTDELTGLANLRQLHATLNRELERSRRFRSPLGLLMIDIDDFKPVNDTYGHQQGDEVLAAVASVLRDHSRDIDTPARYGGEELTVILPETDSEGAAQVGERMREAIERLRVPLVRGQGQLRVTASFGAASIPDSASDKESLIASSDAALYRAKRAGKNRVERATPVATPS